MSHVVVVNPDDTLMYGSENRNTDIHTPLEVNVPVFTPQSQYNTRMVYTFIIYDIIKVYVYYYNFYSSYWIMCILSCIICVNGLRKSKIRYIQQYGIFHLLENVLVIANYFYSKNVYILINCAFVIFLNTLCFISTVRYVSYLRTSVQ